MILADVTCASIVLNRNDRYIMDSYLGVINYNHPVGPVNFNIVYSSSTGEHQPIVGIKFAQLARPNFHIQHDSPAQRLVNVLPNKRKLCLAAHAVGAPECQIPTGASAKIQHNALRPEHTLCLFLPDGMTVLCGIPVEDIAEIHVADHVRQVTNQSVLHR